MTLFSPSRSTTIRLFSSNVVKATIVGARLSKLAVILKQCVHGVLRDLLILIKRASGE